MASPAGGSSRPSDPARERDKAQSVTEAKALKMTSVYHERIKKEIEAVIYKIICKLKILFILG